MTGLLKAEKAMHIESVVKRAESIVENRRSLFEISRAVDRNSIDLIKAHFLDIRESIHRNMTELPYVNGETYAEPHNYTLNLLSDILPPRIHRELQTKFEKTGSLQSLEENMINREAWQITPRSHSL